MIEAKTATFVLYDDHGNRELAVAAGDSGEGEKLVEGVEARGYTVVEVQVCDVSDVSPRSAFWETGILGPRPDAVQDIGRVVSGATFVGDNS